jgi:hypothetical protein
MDYKDSPGAGSALVNNEAASSHLLDAADTMDISDTVPGTIGSSTSNTQEDSSTGQRAYGSTPRNLTRER